MENPKRKKRNSMIYDETKEMIYLLREERKYDRDGYKSAKGQSPTDHPLKILPYYHSLWPPSLHASISNCEYYFLEYRKSKQQLYLDANNS